jgi:lipoyl-dependent peroxiredoxin
MAVLFETTVRVTGGREGRAVSADGSFDLRMSPKDGTNPEQLFAAGYGACYLSALNLVGRQEGKPIPPEASVNATVSLQKDDAGAYGLEVSLEVSVPGMDKAEVQAMAEKAHAICPYSRAVAGNVDVRITVDG